MSSQSPPFSRDELDALELRGRRDACPDGHHLIAIGLIASMLFLGQWWLDTRDVLTSAVVWWWQPLLLVAWIVATLRRDAVTAGGARSPESSAYRATFSAVATGLLVFLLGSALGDGMDGRMATIVLCVCMASAFAVLSATSRLRWMWAFCVAWFLLLAFFSARASLAPSDYFLLSAACLGLVSGPGIALMIRRRRMGSEVQRR